MTRRMLLLAVLSVGCGGAVIPSGRATYRDVTAGAAAAASGGSVVASSGVSSIGPRRSFDGIAGGPIEAMGWDSACRGWIPETPQISLDLPIPASLVVSGTSSVDTTMVVVFPDGHMVCNDDTNGLNPQVTADFGAGHYRIYIGTYGQSDVGAAFHVEVGPS